MTVDSCYKIGFVMKPHGLKGEVTIALEPEVPTDLAAGAALFVQLGERLLPFFIQSISSRGDKAFLKFEEVNDREEAARIAGSSLFLPKTSRPKSGPGEFYDDEVIGFEVSDTALGALGKIREIVQAGPNKLLSIDHEGKEVLVPLNGPFVQSVSKKNKSVMVTLPEGFLEI